MLSTCPYCLHPVSAALVRFACPACRHAIFNVPCPLCQRKTLNLTHLTRYGRICCFACQAVLYSLPVALPDTETPAACNVAGVLPTHRLPLSTSGIRRTLVLPNVVEARQALGECVEGIQQAMHNTESLPSPALLAVIAQFLDSSRQILALETSIANGEITPAWLREEDHLQCVVRLCCTPMWPAAAMLLPSVLQGWMLALNEAIHRWQFARRVWLSEICGLTLQPVTMDNVDFGQLPTGRVVLAGAENRENPQAA